MIKAPQFVDIFQPVPVEEVKRRKELACLEERCSKKWKMEIELL